MKTLTLKEYGLLLKEAAEMSPTYKAFREECTWICNVSNVGFPSNTQLEFIWGKYNNFRVTDKRQRHSVKIGVKL